MDDIFSRLLTLTTYISHQFIQFIEDLAFRNIRSILEDLVTISCFREGILHHGMDYISLSDGISAFPGCSEPRTNFCITKTRTSERGDLPVNSQCQTVQRMYSSGGYSFIFKGLMLPICCLRGAWMLTAASWRHILSYAQSACVQVLSVISRLRRTLHGSSDDIGWLQRDPGTTPAEDGSVRFLEILQCIRNGEHGLPDSFVYLLIPGLLSNYGPLYFVSTKKSFSKMGLACHIAKIHSEASVEHNAWVLKHYIEELFWGSGKLVMLLGHSKGGVDAAAALSMYWGDLMDKVAGLAFVQSPFGGTPIASDILREGQIADKQTRRIIEFVICKLIKGDTRALEDLTYEKRKEFIKKYKLPSSIPMISFHSEASITPGVIAAMSYIAHAELPWLPSPYFGRASSVDVEQARRQVPVVLPMSAVMAVCALHLRLRYGEKSDGLVTCRDAEVPGSIVVKPDMKLDHAWTVYPSWKKNPMEPDSTDMCEALLTMLVELGKKNKNRTGDQLDKRDRKFGGIQDFHV